MCAMAIFIPCRSRAFVHPVLVLNEASTGSISEEVTVRVVARVQDSNLDPLKFSKFTNLFEGDW
jgi:hypothetical protein